MVERELSMSFSPKFENIDMARAAIQGICHETYKGAEAGPLVDELCLAAAEAMNNAVEHSGSAMIEVGLLARENEMVIRLTSTGGRFDPTLDVSYPDLDGPDGPPEGGFGRAIIREMVDDWGYEYHSGRNVLTLRKLFP